MAYGGRASWRTALYRAEQLGRDAARNPKLCRSDNPCSRSRPDLRAAWDEGYRSEYQQMVYKEGIQ